MSTAVTPPVETKIDQVDVQARNKRYVQIDAIGVGTASAAAPFLPVFLIAGSAYLLALLIIHLLVPKLEPAVLRAPPRS